MTHSTQTLKKLQNQTSEPGSFFTRHSYNKKSNKKLILYHIIIIFIYHASLLLISFAQIAILCNRKTEPYRFSLHKRSKPSPRICGEESLRAVILSIANVISCSFRTFAFDIEITNLGVFIPKNYKRIMNKIKI